MTRIWSILVLVIAMLSTGVVSGGEPPTEAELKARFSQRHVPLKSLKDASKIGETTDGLVEVVRAAHAKGKVTLPDDRTLTVGALVQEENADRKKLYALIGKRTNESAAAVAEQAAIRNFKQAKPDHYLKLGDGKWVQKKQLPKPKS